MLIVKKKNQFSLTFLFTLANHKVKNINFLNFFVPFFNSRCPIKSQLRMHEIYFPYEMLNIPRCICFQMVECQGQ